MTIGLIFILLAGCSNSESTSAASEVSNQNEDHKESEKDKEKALLAKKLSNYETVELTDKTERSDLQVNYPKFDYEPLDKLIEPEATNTFDHHKKAKDDEDFFSEPAQVVYTFTSEFDEPVITDDFVSLHFNDYIYAGGAHGSPGTSSLYFDLEKNRELTIEEVLEKHEVSLEALSDLIANKIITDDRYRGYHSDPDSNQFEMDVIASITPDPDNFSTFKVTDEDITIYNTYYGFFPLAAGTVDTEVSWKDLQERTKKLEQKTESVTSDSLTYMNDDYDFELTLPPSWEDKFTVDKDSAASQPSESSYNFNFTVDGDTICNIFTIYVYDEDNYQEVPLEQYITRKDGKVYTYGTIMEIPIEFSTDPLLDNEVDGFSEMVNEDVPEIIKSLTF